MADPTSSIISCLKFSYGSSLVDVKAVYILTAIFKNSFLCNLFVIYGIPVQN